MNIRLIMESLRPIFGHRKSAITNYVGTFDDYWTGLPGYCNPGTTMDSAVTDKEATEMVKYYIESLCD